MSDKQKEMKSLVESIVAGLTKQGVKVTDAAVLKLDDVKDSKQADAIIKEAIAKFGGKGFPFPFPGAKQEANPQQKTEEKEEDQGPCFCPNCFNFETFESVLSTQPGALFDYGTITFKNGKKFDVKYYDGPYGERIMLSPQEYKVDPDWTTDTIIGELNNAVAQKQFDKAQVLLNALNNRKTN